MNDEFDWEITIPMWFWTLLCGVLAGNAGYDAVTHHVSFDWVWMGFWALCSLLCLMGYIRDLIRSAR